MVLRNFELSLFESIQALWGFLRSFESIVGDRDRSRFRLLSSAGGYFVLLTLLKRSTTEKLPFLSL